MKIAPVTLRTAAATVLAGSVAVLAAGCNFIAPQHTFDIDHVVDGRNVTVGEVALRNVLAITDDGAEASLVMVLLNSGEEDAQVRFEYDTEAGTESQVVDVPAGTEVRRGTAPDEEQLVIDDLDVTPGALLPVFVQYGAETGQVVDVPVLTGGLPEYSTLLPTPLDTGSATPTPLFENEDGTPSPEAEAGTD